MNTTEILLTDNNLNYNTNYELLDLVEKGIIGEEDYYDCVDPCDLDSIKDGIKKKSYKRRDRRAQKSKAKNKLIMRRKNWHDNKKWWEIYNKGRDKTIIFYKKYSNRYLRHTTKEFALKGRSHRKTFDFAWKVY